jgi:hypothetical protein
LAGARGAPQSKSTHVGAVPLQLPLAWHVCVEEPESTYPDDEVHEYVAVDPYVSIGSDTEPFVGPARLGQVTIAHVGAAPLQAPVA